jgi:hypothetical protein
MISLLLAGGFHRRDVSRSEPAECARFANDSRRTDNETVEPDEVIAELWRRIQARDWDAVGELVAEDFVLETRKRANADPRPDELRWVQS